MNPGNEWVRPDDGGGEGDVELCPCPECGLPAEVVAGDSPRIPGSELVGVRCIDRHWFFGLRDRLVA